MDLRRLLAIGMYLGMTFQVAAHAGVFGEPDRMIADEYGAVHFTTGDVIRQRYAASGDFHCGGMLSQGQVVVRKNTILVSAHAIFVTNSCERRASIATCTFTVTAKGLVQNIPVKALITAGYECSGSPRFEHSDDWALLELETNVEDGVLPYAVNTRERIGDRQVVAVGKSRDFVQIRAGKRTYPRHYGDCQIIDDWGDELGTNCDSSGYSSGGGLFYAVDGPPTLIGILQGSSETNVEIKKAESAGTINKREYDSATWDSVYVPIVGQLKATLTELSRERE